MSDTGKLRIVHIVRSPIGGIFRHIVDLAEGQIAAGHDVGVICDSLTGDAMSARWIARLSPQLSLGLHRVPMLRTPGPQDMLAVWNLARLIRKLSPDVLHGHGAKGGVFARVIGSWLGFVGKRPLRIYCPHGGSLHYDPKSAQGRIQFMIERLLARVTDGFIFVSNYEERTFRTKVTVPLKPVRRVFNGLKPEEFELLEPSEYAADLVHVGMLRKLKGTQVLIEALKRLAERENLRPTLRIIGAGEDRHAFEAQVVEAGLSSQVHFFEPMPIRDALAQGRILVVPSLAESMPYVVIEASAAGMPVVATRVGGIGEIFGDLSDHLVPPDNPAALAAKIGSTLRAEAEARERALAIREAIAEDFSADHMVASTLEFYGDLMTPRRARRVEAADTTQPQGKPARGRTLPLSH
ncbi:glycosyltransferase [Oryzibacter oryziterrae]|uniref:glycosyltransferase n=1 Tax=Oryzibacter oryziterrae TaxID=2766474 RepID=UPI001F470508|nr:glycosyltransferase [Oryzibacter oryziterrae]